MKYNDFIEKLGVIVEKYKLLLRVHENMIYVDSMFFYEETINKIQRLLQLYGECEWWILASDTIANGVMYRIKIFRYK